MNLTAVWFVINIFFVTSFIVTLFVHRAVTNANLERGNPQRAAKLKTIRNVCIVVTAILFVAMSTAFLANMRING